MNPSHATYTPSGPQQFPYGAAFGAPPARPVQSIPHPQHHLQQYPHQQQGFPQQQPYPPRSQPQYFQQQQANQRVNLQSPIPNGRPGGLNQSGAFSSAEGTPGQQFSAPPFNQPMSSSTTPTSAPQNLQQPYPGTTGASQQSTPAMATPGQMVSPGTPTTQHQQRPLMGSGAFGAQPQVQNQAQAQAQSSLPPLSPKSATREKARVTVLLEINSQLLQEIITLQSQGKAGLPGQAENAAGSPTSAIDPQNALNSPSDPLKSGSNKQPSPECADCMRRLQANLSYLAAVADRHKRTSGTFPACPAILTPPPHLKTVNDLYGKLNQAFPGALQAIAKQNAVAMAQTQAKNQGQGRPDAVKMQPVQNPGLNVF